MDRCEEDDVDLPEDDVDLPADDVEADMIETVNNENDPENIEEGEHDYPNKPCIGMEISCPDAAYNLYLSYARYVGFRVRKHSTFKSRKTGNIIGRSYVCSKEGLKRVNNEVTEGKDIKRKRDTRVSCKARMSIRLNEETGIWRICTFDDIHNHEFTTPSKTGCHRSHKQFHKSPVVTCLVHKYHDAGACNTEITRAVNANAPSEEETLTNQQTIDILRKRRASNIGSECISVIMQFEERKKADPMFFFALELDSEMTVRSIFWADGRSRSSYLEFGDVVSFDLTYKSNSFLMPFAPFTGVNHHRQSTLFGCALLADEEEETFIWLFNEWLKCMFGKAPGLIITDQDPAICNAIKHVFPDTRHCYCMSHVNKLAMEHLHLLRSNNNEFVKDYYNWFQSETILESEKLWADLLNKYAELSGNSWLMSMYNEKRCHWVPAYTKDIFTAGMNSTQRSESINAFFDGYVHSMTPFHEFVTQYDKALNARRKAEKQEDFFTLESKPRCTSGLEIEKQAARCYTRKMYDIFLVEFTTSQAYCREKVRKNDDRREYIVGLKHVDKCKWRHVIYDRSDGIVFTCSCAKFETEGMLCRHIFSIMRVKMVDSIPQRYILHRWTINARFRGGNASSSSIRPNNSVEEITPLMIFSLQACQNKIFQKALSSEKIFKEYHSWLKNKLDEITKDEEPPVEIDRQKEIVEPVPQVVFVQSQSEVHLIRDPNRSVIPKGRPSREKRYKAGIDVSQEQREVKRRQCGYCKQLGHYISGCALRKQQENARGEI